MDKPEKKVEPKPLSDMATIIFEVDKHETDLVWLSNKCMELASHGYTLATAMAIAELNEQRERTRLLDEAKKLGEKLSVAEAEVRAVVNCQNKHGLYKAQYDASVHVINAIKSKVKVLLEEKAGYGKGGDTE